MNEWKRAPISGNRVSIRNGDELIHLECLPPNSEPPQLVNNGPSAVEGLASCYCTTLAQQHNMIAVSTNAESAGPGFLEHPSVL